MGGSGYNSRYILEEGYKESVAGEEPDVNSYGADAFEGLAQALLLMQEVF